MLRLGIGFLLVACVVPLCGCGGGTGGDASATVAIQSVPVPAHPGDVRTRFFPKTATIPAGPNNGIMWVNQDFNRHQIVSGVLTSQGNPSIKHIIVINVGFFTPDELEVNSGDTIQFSNLSGRTFTMQIANDNGAVVSTVIFTIGELRTVVFPGPGVWTVQDQDSQLVATITLLGHPVPDGQFQSGILNNGGVYQKAFTVPGNSPYYDSNPDDPTHVYATGTIVAQ